MEWPGLAEDPRATRARPVRARPAPAPSACRCQGWGTRTHAAAAGAGDSNPRRRCRGWGLEPTTQLPGRGTWPRVRSRCPSVRARARPAPAPELNGPLVPGHTLPRGHSGTDPSRRPLKGPASPVWAGPGLRTARASVSRWRRRGRARGPGGQRVAARSRRLGSVLRSEQWAGSVDGRGRAPAAHPPPPPAAQTPRAGPRRMQPPVPGPLCNRVTQGQGPIT